MDYDECWAADPDLPKKMAEFYFELGIFARHEGEANLSAEFWEAKRNGELEPVEGAISPDDYAEKTRAKLSAWANSQKIVESETFESKLSRRLQIRKTDIRPREHAVLGFPMPSSDPD